MKHSPRGEFLTGLTADDFRIYDDDIQQKISVFEKDDGVYGTTVLFDALTQALHKVADRKQERKALIVISDGNDNGSVSGFGTVSDAAQQSGTLIYFVAIGSRVLVDEHTVESLAAVSGGRVIYMTKDRLSSRRSGCKKNSVSSTTSVTTFLSV